MNEGPVSGSFRDPSGHVFRFDGVLYRQVNPCYKSDYDRLLESGLYDGLVEKKLLVSHEEVSLDLAQPGAYRCLKPDLIPFISYPYEWSFSQLKDAALITLRIQEEALKAGMSLKDASAFNIQFLDSSPIFIDTLSFEGYREGEPWVGYRQFCQHFLAPLALMALVDIRLSSLIAEYIDGVPLDLASKLLPVSSKLRLGLLTHVHLHAGSQKRFEGKQVKSGRKVSKNGLLGILDNLKSTITRLEWKPEGTVWGDYYSATNYTDTAFERKKDAVSRLMELANPSTVWDLGANTGVFSRIAAHKGIPTVAFDIDPAAVELNYLEVKKNRERCLLPLVQDLSNPSSSLGWRSSERSSFFERGPVDLILALALVHHLAISNNVPLADIARFFASVCQTLIIEFVPKDDSQVERMLAVREDVFPEYTQEGFELSFKREFEMIETVPVEGSKRTLYLMRAKG